MQAVLCHEGQRARCSSSWSTPIAYAKLKQSQLFERDDVYGIDDACKIEAVQLIRTRGHLQNDIRYKKKH